jgi:hypothetical protein
MKKHFPLMAATASSLFFAALFCASHAAAIIVAKSGAAYSTIQAGLSAANAGDTVYVKAGTYLETVTFGKSGAAGAPIVLRNFGTDAPIVDGNGTAGTVVAISDKSNVQIIGFEVENASGGDPSIGIGIDGAGNNILVKDCKVHDITSDTKNAHGIAAYGTSGASPIKNIMFDGNEVYNCKLGQSESVVLNGNVDSFQVINNTVHDNDNIGIDFIGFEGTASAGDQARDGLCAANHVYNISSKSNPTYGGDQSADGIYVDGGTNIVIERNIVDSCDCGIEIGCEHSGKTTNGIMVRNNFVSRSYQGDIMAGGYDASVGSVTDVTIVNNTTYHSNDGEVLLQYHNSGITVKNNILFAKSGEEYVAAVGTGNTNIVADNNLYYGGSTSSPGAASDAHAVFANPLLVNPPADLHLTSTSPALRAGALVPDSICGTLAIDGQPRIVGGAIDIGADEYGSTPVIGVKRQAAVPGSMVRLEKTSPSTWLLRYTLAEPADVAYTLFDVNGRTVYRSTVSRQPSGARSLVIQCGARAAQVYCVRAKMGNALESFTIAPAH